MSIIRSSLLICGAVLFALGCRDDSTTAPLRQLKAGQAARDVYVDNPAVFMLSVEVSGAGVPDGYRYDITIAEGRSPQSLAIPAGGERRVVLRAYDQYGRATHEGTIYLGKVAVGANDAVNVTLNPLVKVKPASVSLNVMGETMLRGGQLMIQVGAKVIHEGETVPLHAIYTDPYGKSFEVNPNDVRWGVGDPMGGRIEIGTSYAMYTASKVQLGNVYLVDGWFKGVPDHHEINPVPDPFVDVRAGGNHTCALRQSGGVYCWGDNGSGQLGSAIVNCGSNQFNCQARPTHINTAIKGAYRRLATGGQFSCAIDSNYWTICWGNNAFGQLGNAGQTGTTDVPQAVLGGVQFQSITAGDRHACAIGIPHGVFTTNNAYCWGDNTHGQLAIDPSKQSSANQPTIILGYEWSEVTAGQAYTCGMDGLGYTYCWGSQKQLGHSATGDEFNPGQTFGFVAVDHLSVGPFITACAMMHNSTSTECWGDNTQSQAGLPTPPSQIDLPTTISGSPPAFSMVATGFSHSCAVSTQSDAYCWGSNSDGQLGTGGSIWSIVSAPALVSGGLKFTRVAAGSVHSCGLTIDGDIYCWGQGSKGKLGNAAFANSLVPVKVAP